MKPRITININKEGELEIWLNPARRDLLVRELQQLSESSDHFHLGSEDFGGEVSIQAVPYREGDRIVTCGKVLFRPDAWDAEHFPHVVGVRPATGS